MDIADVLRLLSVGKRLRDTAVYEDGNVILGALDFELFERSLHRVDRDIYPSRVDSSADPCPYNCAYCRANDIPS